MENNQENKLEFEFKVLMYEGMYVEGNMLMKGLYSSTTPYIFPKDDTIEKIVQRVQGVSGIMQIPEEYYINLKKCELVPVKLMI